MRSQWMAAQQQSCPEVAEMLSSGNLQITSHQGHFNEDVLPASAHPVERGGFQLLHSIHHPGVRVTRRLITAQFCWPQMAKAITCMARTCLFCQRGKVYKHVGTPPTSRDTCAYGRRNFKDTNTLLSFSLVILFGVVK
jgi:hypothetical protein